MTCAGGRDQASFVLCMDEGVHGGWEGAVDPGRGAGRQLAGGTPAQARERRAQAVGGGAVPGGIPSEKNGHTDAPRRRYQKMSAVEKAEVLVTVASSSTPKRKVLSELGVPRSTYYRWLRRSEQRGLENDAGGGRPAWNRMTSGEVDHVLSAAREMPELSPRQLASWVTDTQGFSVSESTVYRILRREGLVKRPETRLAAGKEYHRKTMGPHQMWATDASYFRVVGWGYHYLVTVMDDYSRFIPSASSGQAWPGGFRGT